nr:unnamed protein product [Digitaria exilis]
MALGRWKPFLGAFQHIDAAIEASSGDGASRDEFRRARARIVELLRDASTGDGDGEAAAAEELGLLLDEAMAGALATLRAVPAGRIPALLAAPGGVVGAVGALMKGHAAERVRGLARDVVREWKLSVGAELARARTAMDVLNGISDDTNNAKRPSANTEAPAAVSAQPPRKPTTNTAVVSVGEEQRKMEATKRKLQERYQETEDAKRRRTIQVIKPPRPETKAGQRQSIAHPAMTRARRPAASGTVERRVVMKPSSLE